MTANEDPYAEVESLLVDLDALEQMLSKCVKSEDDWLRTFAAITELRNRRSTRASIGPDSERIREVIATAIAAGKNPARKPQPLDYENADEILAALRAAGLLPGRDGIVVSREEYEKLQALFDDALFLRMYGDQPPWGTGSWGAWDHKAETYTQEHA